MVTQNEIISLIAYLLIGMVGMSVIIYKKQGELTAFDLLVAFTVGWMWPIFVPLFLGFSILDKLTDKLDNVVIWRRK
jgi:hypothetical protein